jgi:hypothetical protein
MCQSSWSAVFHDLIKSKHLLQVIQSTGAKAVVTAGSSTKRALLRMLGASTAVSSRDTMFADEIMLQVGFSRSGLLVTCLHRRRYFQQSRQAQTNMK